jgi:hypothetical protein
MSTVEQAGRGRRSAEVLPPYAAQPSGWRPVLGRILLYGGAAGFCLFYGMAFGLVGQFLPLLFIIPIGVLLMLVIWALPPTTKAPVRLLEGLFFAFIIGAVAWPNYLALALPGLPWITVARLTGAPLTLVLLVCVSTSKPFRVEMASTLNASPLIWRMLVGFVVIQAMSIFLSSEKAFSLDRFASDQMAWTAVFFASAYVLSKPGRGWRLAWILWGLGVLVGGIGLLEGHEQHVLWANHIPSFLRIEDPSVMRKLAGLILMYGGGYRVQSTLSGPIQVGEFYALIMPFVLHLLVRPGSLYLRAAVAASIVAFFAVVYQTDSRSGMTTFGLSFIMYGLYWGWMWWRRRPENFLGMMALLCYPLMLVLAVLSVFFVGRVRNKVLGTGIAAASTEARVNQWHMGMPKLLHHPEGHGVGMAGDTLGYALPNGQLTIDTYYLSVLLEYGVIGFVVYFGTFIAAIYRAVVTALSASWFDDEVSLAAPAAVSLTNFVFTKSVLSQEDNHSLAFLMLGVVLGLASQARRPARRSAYAVRAPAIA